MSHWKSYEWDTKAVRNLVEEYARGEDRGNLKVLKYMIWEKRIMDVIDVGLLDEMDDILARVGIQFQVVEARNPEEGRFSKISL